MTYDPSTWDNHQSPESRAVADRLINLKLDTSNTAAYKLLPRNVKSCAAYCKKDHWVRVDEVEQDPETARDLSDTSKDNVIFCPGGFTTQLPQGLEYNCISAVTAVTDEEDTLLLYPGKGELNDLVGENFLA